MRYSLLVGSLLCLAVWLTAAEARAQDARSRHGKQPAAQQTVRAETPEDRTVWPEETIKGFGKNRAEAEEDALQKAQNWVQAFLRRKHPETNWKPSVSFVRKHLVAGEAKHLQDLDQAIGKGADAVVMECWGLPVAVTRETNALLVRAEREYHSQELRAEREGRMAQRMDLLAKLLAAVVALLAAFAGYLKLEDLTKGYYTWWLRSAVLLFLGFVALMLCVA